jgi:hypothetical protein
MHVISNKLKSALIRSLPFLPSGRLNKGSIFTFVIHVIMHYISVLHRWIIFPGIGFLITGCQVNNLNMKCMGGYEDSNKGKYSHYTMDLPDRYIDGAVRNNRPGIFIQLYHIDGFLVTPTTILSQVPENNSIFRKYLIDDMNRCYDSIKGHFRASEDLWTSIDHTIQEKIKGLVDEAMQSSADITYKEHNIKFLTYLEEKVMNHYNQKYCNHLGQQYKQGSGIRVFDKTQIQIRQNSLQRIFNYKKYFEQVLSFMFHDKEIAKNLLMDAFAKSDVDCHDPECVKARHCCLSMTRDEIELLNTLYEKHHVDAGTAAAIFLDYWGKSSSITPDNFLNAYEINKKKELETENNARVQEYDLHLPDILQELEYTPSSSGPISNKKKKIKRKQKQPSPSSSQEIKTRHNEIAPISLMQESLPSIVFVKNTPIHIGVSQFAQHPRVEKWEKKNIQELLDYFKNVDECSPDSKYRDINTNEERIKIEKRRHDLFPVEHVLVQPDTGRYFVYSESQSPYGTQHKYMAKAMLEYQEDSEEKKQTGMIDIVVSPDKKKIFHQMFRKDKGIENTLKCSMPTEAHEQNDAKNFTVVPNKRTGMTRSIRKQRLNHNHDRYVIEFLAEETNDLCKRLYIMPYKQDNAKLK